MKKSKKVEKAQSRIASYLEKETRRLEKILSVEIDGKSPAAQIHARLRERQAVALADAKLLEKLNASKAKTGEPKSEKITTKKTSETKKRTTPRRAAPRTGASRAKAAAKPKAQAGSARPSGN